MQDIWLKWMESVAQNLKEQNNLNWTSIKNQTVGTNQIENSSDDSSFVSVFLQGNWRYWNELRIDKT